MKSTDHPSKTSEKQDPKLNGQISKFIPTPVDDKLPEELTTGQQPIHVPVGKKPLEPPKVEPQVTGKRNKKKIDFPPATKPHIPFQDRSEEPELPPSPCQHMQFLDCNLEVGRITFECYHCNSGIISEYTGEPVMGEYKGRPKSDFHKGKMPRL